MFSGSFAGSAAQGLNQSLLEWQRIWLAEEEMEKQDQREKDRMAFEEQRLAWERERTEMAEQGADRRFIQQRGWEVLDNLWEKFNSSTSPAAQAAMAETFRGTGYYDMAVSSIQQGLFANHMEATAFLGEVINADIGARYDPAVVRAAAEVSGRFGLNLEGDELTDYINRNVEWANTLDEEFTEERERQRQNLNLETQQAQANLEETQGRTKLSEAQIRHIDANIELGKNHDMREESRLIWEGEAHQNNMYKFWQDYNHNERINPLLIQALSYDNDGKLLDLDIRNATKDVTIQRILDEAGLVGIERQLKDIELKYAWEHAELDIAIKTNNRDHLTASIEALRQNIKESEARITSAGIDDEVALAELREKRIATFTRLMSSGDVELATEYADSFLRDIVSEDSYDRIIDTMRDRAFLALDAEEAQLRANTTVAFYEEVYAREMAELRVREARARTSTAEVDAAFRERQNEMDLAVSEANIAVARGTLALQQAKATGSGGTPNLETVMKAVKSATGYDMSDVGNALDSYRIASADIAEERDAINAAIANPTPQNLEAVYNITGIRPRNAEEALELLAQREAGWTTRLESSSQEAQNVISTIFNWAAPMGVPLSPQMFGLREADYIIYYNAIQNNPAYRTVPEEVPQDQRAMAADTFATIDSLSYGRDAAEITLGGAEAAYAELKATTPEGMLESLGIHEPADLHTYMVTSSREYDQNLQTATELVNARGYNISNSDDRQRALANVNSAIQTAGVLVAGLGGAGQMSDSEREELKQSAVQWLASNGRQLSFAEEIMYGPGDLIQAINQIKGELSNGSTALNWLIPRMAIQDAKGQLAP